MYAKVIVDITHEKLDRVFEYGIPEELDNKIRVGMEVIIPFGQGDRKISGYVIDISETCAYDKDKVKSIIGPAPKKTAIEGNLISLAAWMREQYGGTMIQALKTVLPIKKERIRKRKSREGLRYETEEEIKEGPRDRHAAPPVYTAEQLRAIDIFTADYDKGLRKTYLLYGITGSGKTEVYMEMISRVVRDGKQSIVLIPEIALTYQMVLRFYRRFGDRISILNSRMTDLERYDQMMRAKDGKVDVMIGPRSALFTPFPSLGLIVIDEEHEHTYKSEVTPRYHARETAAMRAHLEGASLVLGSATPSMEAFYRAKHGEYELLTLMERAKKQELAAAYAVDMREELKRGNRSIISVKLRELMQDRLNKKQQIILFLNRRGYEGFVSCRSCGYVAKCPHCDVSMTIHKGDRMICHYCGYEEPVHTSCPVCGSAHIGGFRAWTQKIEDLVAEEFPGARVLRMDMDTTKGKSGYEKILKTFAGGQADILTGTQMIVKGHDFPNVTLVGILAADMSLYAEDFRAAERTFQLLTQAAGRAGRGDLKGEVVIQTYSPEHYAIKCAVKQDYEAFYRQEIAYRKLMGYPPARNMLAVLVSGEDEELLNAGCGYLRWYAGCICGGKLQILGPASPYVGKVQDQYRKALYIKHEDYNVLTQVKDKLEQYIEVNPGFRKLWIQFDFNPMRVF